MGFLEDPLRWNDGYDWHTLPDPPYWMLYDKDDDQLMEEYDNEIPDSVVEGEWWTREEGARPVANEW